MVTGQNAGKEYKLKNVRTVKHLGLSKQTMNAQEMAGKFPHLRHLPLESYSDAQPMLLIGLDNNHVAIPLRVKEGAENEPIALKSRLGWTVSGKTNGDDEGVQSLHVHKCACPDERLDELLEHYYNLDSYKLESQRTRRHY